MEINLNDGHGHGFDEIKQIGVEQAAEQFSEGNETLKQILLNLWEMGIDTAASCKGEHTIGHKSENDMFFKFPYISFKVNEFNKSKLMQLIKYVVNEKSSSMANIEFKNYIFNNQSYSTLIFDRTFLTNANVNKMFKSILSAVEKMQRKEKIQTSEEIKLTTQLIEEISSKEIFRGQPVNLLSVKISHKGDCQFTAKDIYKKTVKQKINNETIDKISKFCDECLFEKSCTI